MSNTGGELLVKCLLEQGVDTAFGVPGESYLAVLDALYDVPNQIKLITNNPKKVEHLTSLGINVTKRIPIKIKPNEHNKKYLDTKSSKSGHLL